MDKISNLQHITRKSEALHYLEVVQSWEDTIQSMEGPNPERVPYASMLDSSKWTQCQEQPQKISHTIRLHLVIDKWLGLRYAV